jgi:protein-S-isoprenylcysteine O-methyltransferase Ste14
MSIFTIAYVCWGIMLAVWVFGALYNQRYAPRAEATWASANLVRVPGFFLAAIAVFLIERFVPRSVWAPITFHSEPLAIAGLVLLVVSTAFTVWARVSLGTMWSSVPTRKEHHELRTDGAYRFSRHPIYTGILGMLIGSCLVWGFGQGLVALIVFGAIFAVRIRREEQILTETFGEQYVHYQHRVPQLLPRPRF